MLRPLKCRSFSPFLSPNQAKVGKANRVCYGNSYMAPPIETDQPGVIQIDETKAKANLDTPWNVIVHNDPINLMSYVTMVFMRVFGYPRPKAEMHMLEVHHKGRSLVWSGGREQAEHYVHQLHSYQLLATMEKSEA
jgi:ATP-dependent Clp protease adaptor protein ClpS